MVIGLLVVIGVLGVGVIVLAVLREQAANDRNLARAHVTNLERDWLATKCELSKVRHQLTAVKSVLGVEATKPSFEVGDVVWISGQRYHIDCVTKVSVSDWSDCEIVSKPQTELVLTEDV
jgi:hypothetical protein